jgi:hypothetical protein
MNERWDFFDSDAFHGLLTRMFRVPFESRQDYFIRGYVRQITPDVRVFTGRIRSRDHVARLREDGSAAPAHWWDGMRLLVTDSDPQYIFVWIGLGEGDELELETP